MNRADTENGVFLIANQHKHFKNEQIYFIILPFVGVSAPDEITDQI